MTTTKLTLLSLATLFVGGAAQCANGCSTTLTNAQVCLRECVNMNPNPAWGGAHNFATNGASRLWQCLPGNGKTKVFNADPLLDLMACCEMTDACKQTMKNARTCAGGRDGGTSCIPSCVKSQARRYMNCIVSKSKAKVCNFAGLCVGQLTGNDAFDFADVLTEAAKKVTSSNCSPMDPFVDGLCDISNRCCDDCNTGMSSLVSCLVNDFLLPLSSTAANVQCQISTPVGGPCAITGASGVSVGRTADRERLSSDRERLSDSMGGGRFRSMEDTQSNEEVDLGAADISDCEESLTFNFLVHNQTYAVDEFMSCIGKKIGQIVAEADTTASSTEENSSSATTVFGIAALSLSSFLMAAFAL